MTETDIFLHDPTIILYIWNANYVINLTLLVSVLFHSAITCEHYIAM
jgi:hypothetical protein